MNKTIKVIFAFLGLIVVSLPSCVVNKAPSLTTNNLVGAGINIKTAEKEYIEGIGNCFYLCVRHYQTILKFADYVETNRDATWTVSTDVSGFNVVPNRTVELLEGNPKENLYYIYVSNDSAVDYQTYPVLIHRNFMYVVSFDTNGGSICDSINVEEGFCINNDELTTPTKTGYNFVGWDYNFATPVNGNITISAIWEGVLNNLVVTSENDAKGTATIVEGCGYSGENILVFAQPKIGYVFKGWYSNNELVSEDANYSFIMPVNDYTLEARFYTDQEYWDLTHGAYPLFSLDGKTLQLGLYPQTHINDENLINKLNCLDDSSTNSNGWYLYNKEYYVKTLVSPNVDYCWMSTHVLIHENETHWFKCEPITWKVLKKNNKEFYVISSKILDIGCYCNTLEERTINEQIIYPNNYKHSDIRFWLNTNFYNSAFSYSLKQYIQTTTVDNSQSSTGSSYNQYYCENTDDKVFMPSFVDYTNGNIFSTSLYSTGTRTSDGSDYAKAIGLMYDGNGSFYWTRTPSGNQNYSYLIEYNGSLSPFYTRCNDSKIGIRPAITIKL